MNVNGIQKAISPVPVTQSGTVTNREMNDVPKQMAVQTNEQGDNHKEKHGEEIVKEDLVKMIEGLNSFLEITSTHMKFRLHEKLDKYYVQIIDDETNNVVKEIPSKKLLDIAAKIQEMTGLLIDEKR